MWGCNPSSPLGNVQLDVVRATLTKHPADPARRKQVARVIFLGYWCYYHLTC